MRRLALLTLALVPLIAAPALAREAVTERWEVTLTVHPDGAIRVEEGYRIAFGPDSVASGYRVIPGRTLEGGISAVAVSAGGQALERAATGEPLTFDWGVDGPDYAITWAFPPISAGVEDFEVAYSVSEALRVEAGIANRFIWTAIPADHPTSIHEGLVTVLLPPGTAVDERLAPASYGTDAEIRVEGQAISFSVSDLPPGEALRVEVYFRVTDESILPEETSRGGYNSTVSLIGFLIALVTLGVIIVVMVRRNKG
jgi:hypothetical protein